MISTRERRFSLQGKRALVTGASSGIGAATARALSEYGADVALVSRDTSKLESLRAEIVARGGRAVAISCDVAVAAACEQAAQRAGRELGDIDILVAAAGLFPNTQEGAGAAELERALAVNFYGAARFCTSLHPGMRRRGGGRIVLVASIGGTIVPSANYEAYGASKAALLQYGRDLAVTLAPDNILVNCLSPGITATPMSAWLPPIYRDLLLAHTPAGRMATADEIAAVAVFLASPAAGYMTGVNVVADGGLSTGYLPDLATALAAPIVASHKGARGAGA